MKGRGAERLSSLRNCTPLLLKWGGGVFNCLQNVTRLFAIRFLPLRTGNGLRACGLAPASPQKRHRLPGGEECG